MIALNSGSATSLDRKATVKFSPLIRLTKNKDSELPKQLSGNDFEKAKAVASFGSRGFAIFTNESVPEIIESRIGYSAGGFLYVNQTYITIAYDSSSEFKWYVEDAAKMNCEFDSICPTQYISSPASKIMGCPPDSYLAYGPYTADSFDSDRGPMTLPEFSRAFLYGGVPLALSGVVIGTLAPNFMAETRKAAMLLIRNGLCVAPNAKKYGDDEAIVLYNSTRLKVADFIDDLKNGVVTDYKDFSILYSMPDSIKHSTVGSVACIGHLTEESFSAAKTLIFVSDSDYVGVGLRDYINDGALSPRVRVDNWSTDIDLILSSYEEFLKTGLRNGYIAADLSLFEQIQTIRTNVQQLVLNLSGKVGIKFGVDAPFFGPKGREVTLDLSSPDIKVSSGPIELRSAVTSAEEIKGLEDPEALMSIYDKLRTQLLACSDIVEFEALAADLGSDDVVLNIPKFSQAKLDAKLSAYSDRVRTSIGSYIGSILSEFGVGKNPFPGKDGLPEIKYTWSRGLKSDGKCYHEVFDPVDDEEGPAIISGLIRNDTFSKLCRVTVPPTKKPWNVFLNRHMESNVSFDTDDADVNSYVSSFNYIDKVKVRGGAFNASAVGEKESKYSFQFTIYWMGVPSYNSDFPESKIQAFWQDYFRRMIAPSGVFTTPDGLSAKVSVACSGRRLVPTSIDGSVPTWYTVYSCRNKCHSHRFTAHNCLVDGNHPESVATQFAFTVRVSDFSVAGDDFNLSSPGSQDEMLTKLAANKNNIAKTVGASATAKLVRDLDEAGLLTDVSFCSKVKGTLLNLFDGFNVSSLDVDATLPLLVEALYKAYYQKDTSDASAFKYDPVSRERLRSNISEIVSQCAARGIVLKYDQASGTVSMTKNVSQPDIWIMDEEHFNPAKKKVDPDLIGIYLWV